MKEGHAKSKSNLRLIVGSLILALVTVIQSPGASQAQAGARLSESDWGESVAGVQSHLGLASTGPPALPGELPRLEVQFRNRGTETITFTTLLVMNGSGIEIDGRWYSGFAAGNAASTFDVAPGAESSVVPVGFQSALMEEKTRQRLTLGPGKHTVRLRTQSGSSRPGATAKAITLVSNFITIDIPNLTSAEERDLLIKQVSAGGTAGLPAARRLLEKFPDAALDAIRTGALATSDLNVRSSYIELAATTPSDASLAFLKSQLASGTPLTVQITAASALLARNQPDWEPVLIEAWRNMHIRIPATAETQRTVPKLIQLLAKSGSVVAIDALAKSWQAEVDTRVAIVQAFIPPEKSGGAASARDGRGPNLVMAVRGEMPRLPDGPAGVAIERLLAAALNDTQARVGYSRKVDDVSIRDPRVCDIAALVFAFRWPEKFQFRWSDDATQRDTQIAAIRKVLSTVPAN